MPFSLTIALTIFLQMINDLFLDILHKKVMAFLNDILIYITMVDKH